MNRRRTRLTLLVASLLLASAPLAMAAQDSSMQPMHQQNMPMHQQNMPMHKSGMMGKHHMMGMHNMPGTVTAVDHQTGIVKVESLGMPLVVHFPPSTIKDLKAGDKILLHLGYRITGK